MASGRSKKKATAFGLPIPAVILGAVAFVLVGIIGGIVLDVITRPEPLPPRTAARRSAQPPIHLPIPDEEPGSPSILAPRAPKPSSESADPIADKLAAIAAPPAPATPQPMVADAVASTVPANQPALAIVIDDMGLDHTHTLQVLALPGPLTVSIMTYAPDLQALVTQAHAAGDEVIAHVPMEPLDRKQSPGPRALTVAMDDDAIRATLGADLDAWHGYVGINNHMGSRFTGDRARMNVVMGELKNRGLLWLDSKTTTNSAGLAAAQAAGVPSIERDVFLDNTQTVSAVLDELEHAIARAKSHGVAVAIGHPHDATVAALKKALPTLAARGIALVPLTDALKRREARQRS